MAETYLGQMIDVGDVVVYMKNLRTGSSTIRKCKCIGTVRKIKGQNVDIECLKTESTYFNEVSETHRVVDDEGEPMKLVDKLDLLEKKTIMWDEAIGFKECVLLDDIMALPETELIRCKECRHWADGVSGCTDHVKCCKIGFYMVGENGYCVFAERKTDESNSI